MTQDDLRNIFAQYGEVKKAWLQKERQGAPSKNSPAQNHRGFGFIVFSADSSLDQLLGDKFSRYCALPDGKRLEVKRAMSSSTMATGPATGAPAPALKASTPKPSHQRMSSSLESQVGSLNDWRSSLSELPHAAAWAPATWASAPPFPPLGLQNAYASAAVATNSVPDATRSSHPVHQPMQHPMHLMPVQQPMQQPLQPQITQDAPAMMSLTSQVQVPGFPDMDVIAQMLGSTNQDDIVRALLQAMPESYED